jgi:hypothetical protein
MGKQKRIRTQREEDNRPAREGDVLGLSDAPPDVEIPRATADRGGNPQGIEVRQRATGIGDVRQTSGATGVDMGGGGEGTDLSSRPRRPVAHPDEEHEK